MEVSLFTEEGEFVSSVPSGASTGSHEAKELRDGDKSRYAEKGVLKAIRNVEEKIRPALLGKRIDPASMDERLIELDGTEDKSELGANAVLGVSLCLHRAAAKERSLSLHEYLSSYYEMERRIPRPCFNLVNAGTHSGSKVSFQEFMIVPQKGSFKENLRFATEFMYSLKENIESSYGKDSSDIGDEGGFSIKADSAEEILLLLRSVDGNVPVLIDAASTEFFKEGRYFVDGKEMDKEELMSFYEKLAEDFFLLGIEDPLKEDDFEGWSTFKKKLPSLLTVGDDLLVTNQERMKEAYENDSCNAMILKMNQIGTVSETVLAAKKAKEFGWSLIASHRSGETNDDFLADLAVGMGADHIKSGAPQRGERLSKYNRLLQIEKEIFDEK